METKPLSVKELIEGDAPLGSGDKELSKLRHILETLSLPIIFLGGLVFYCPFLTVALLLMSTNDFGASVYFVLMCTIIDLLTAHASWLLHSMLGYRQTYRYLKKEIIGKFRLERHPYFKDLSAAVQLRALAMRVRSLRNTYEPFTGYQVISEDHHIPSQQKGSPLPISGARVNGTHEPASTIYLTDGPDELTSSGMFVLLHEVGHTTKYAWRRKKRTISCHISIFLCATWLMQAQIDQSSAIAITMLIVLRPLFDWFDVFLRYGGFKNLDECIADQFALTCWTDSESIERRRRSAQASAEAQATGWRLRRRASRIDRIFDFWKAGKLRPLDSTFQAAPGPFVFLALTVAMVYIFWNVEFQSQNALILRIHYIGGYVVVFIAISNFVLRYLHWRQVLGLEVAQQNIADQKDQFGDVNGIAVAAALSRDGGVFGLPDLEKAARNGIAPAMIAQIIVLTALFVGFYFSLWLWEYIPVWLTAS